MKSPVDIDLTFLLSACCRRCSHAACPCCGGGISRLDLSARSTHLLHPSFLLFGRTAYRFVARFFFCSPLAGCCALFLQRALGRPFLCGGRRFVCC